jgi:predicted HicB family RNase H-like nuclease
MSQMTTNQTAEYRGYTATFNWNSDCKCYSGKVLDTQAIVGFSGDTLEETHNAFKEILDWYLEECEKNGKEPRQLITAAMAHSV